MTHELIELSALIRGVVAGKRDLVVATTPDTVRRVPAWHSEAAQDIRAAAA